MNNEMNNNVVVAPVESQGLVKSIVSNQRVQGGAIVIGAVALGFAIYKGYKYVTGKMAQKEAAEKAAAPAETPKAA